MKRFVIHIKGSQRHASMIEQMDSQYKGEYEVFDAIVDENPKIGISKSFRTIIKENYNEPFIHIFEDDVLFTSKESRRVFEKHFNNLPSDWQIYLGGSYTYTPREKLNGLLKIENFRSLHSAVIRKSAYDLFLSHDDDTNIDHHVAKSNPKVYLCDPMVAVQSDGYSYNAKKITDYSRYLKGKNILK